MKGYDTRALWLDITQQIAETRERLGQAGGVPFFKSGPSMFGFSDVKIVSLIEVNSHPQAFPGRVILWFQKLRVPPSSI